MIHDHPRNGTPWHSESCRGCEICRPSAPCDRELAPLDKIARIAIAGFAAGLVLAWLYDLVRGGPGIGVMFQ